MAPELLVVAGRPLPGGERPFSLRLEAGVPLEIHELIHARPPPLDFEPGAVLSVSPPHVEGHAVAAALASALGGVVLAEASGRVTFDGRPGVAVDDLEGLARATFEDARRAWLALELAHRHEAQWRFELLEAVDPVLAAENDWSDVG